MKVNCGGMCFKVCFHHWMNSNAKFKKSIDSKGVNTYEYRRDGNQRFIYLVHFLILNTFENQFFANPVYYPQT
jgi:hypothetical protein